MAGDPDQFVHSRPERRTAGQRTGRVPAGHATALPALITSAPKVVEQKPRRSVAHESGRIEIEPIEGEFGKILKIKKP